MRVVKKKRKKKRDEELKMRGMEGRVGTWSEVRGGWNV